MPNNEHTTSFKIDIAELKKGIQDANREIRLANAEFKAASSSMEDWGNSADGLGAKIKQLDTVLSAENKKLESLEKQLEATEKEYGSNSSAADELRIKIANQQATINKTERSLTDYKSQLENVEKGLDDVGEAAKDADGETQSLDDGFTVLKGTMASLIADGVKSLISGLISLVEETKEYRNEMAKLETAFASGGFSAETAKKTYQDFYAVLGDEGQATEAVSFLAKMVDNEKDLATWTDIATGIYAEFGASLPIEGLTEAANETAKVGQVTGGLADALNWVGISEDDFNEKLAKCSSEQERQKLIMDTLNSVYSDSATKFRETNAEVMASNEANAQLADTQARLGETIAPLTTAWTELKTNALQWLMDNGLPALQSGWQWVLDNIPTVTTLVGALTAAWLTFGGAQKIVDGWNKVMAISQAALNAVMNANPIGLIITVIGLLVAAFIGLWNNCEGFRNFFIQMWENIKVATKTFVDWCVNTFNTVKEFFSNFGENVKTIFSNLWKKITEIFSKVSNWFNENVIQPVQTFFTGMWNKLKTGAVNAWNGIKDTFSKVSNWFNENLIQPVQTFFTGMWDGLKNGAKNAWDGVKSIFSNVATFFKNTFTTAWQKVKDVFSTGGKIFDGIKDGIVTSFKTVVNAIIRGINKVVKVPFEGLNGILKKLMNLTIAGINPFSWLTWRAPIPNIPELAKGGVLKRGQVGLLEGDGAEAVVPLEKNTKWLDRIAERLNGKLLGLSGVSLSDISSNTMGIKSPYNNLKRNVGEVIPKAIADGIKLTAIDAIKAMVEMNDGLLLSEKVYLREKERIEREQEEKEYAQKIVNAKDAEEIEKIKQERINKAAEDAQQKYLDELQAKAEKEREIYDGIIEQQNNLSKKLYEEIDAPFKTIEIFRGSTDSEPVDTFYKLTDMSNENQSLKEYSTLIDQLISKRGEMVADVQNNLAGMSVEDGIKYVRAMLDATDEEWDTYISSFTERQTLTDKIAKAIFPVDEIVTNLNFDTMKENANIVWEDVKDTFDEMNPYFDGVCESAKTLFIGAADGITDVVTNITNEVMSKVSKIINTFKQINGVIGNNLIVTNAAQTLTSNTTPTTGTTNVTYFYQTNNSPKALSRLEIYRQTKNQLSLAKGV